MKKTFSESAIAFLLLIGLVSLFSDMSYEGARSIVGPYLGILGASSVIIGFVAGVGEFLGYSLRFVAGWLADRFKRYWEFIFLGYFLSLFSVPLLAFVDNWMFALALLVCERIGKALRTPSRDAILSIATKKIGRGLGFGIHEALDQIGAVLGPLLIAGVLLLRANYKEAFLVLIIPGLFALFSLFLAKRTSSSFLREITVASSSKLEKGFSRTYWIYLLGLCFLGVGFTSFALIGYHLDRQSLLPAGFIPLLYALAMAVDAVFALILGYLYDRVGFAVVLLCVVVSLFSSPLLFLGDTKLVLLGVVLWGVGLGAQESVLRAVIADLVPREKRASGYGVFHSLFGLAMLAGGLLLGVLYKYSLVTMVILSMVFHLLALLVLLYLSYSARSERSLR